VPDSLAVQPILTAVAPQTTAIDTAMAGERELNAVYTIAAAQPCLVEAGPGADGPVVLEGLRRLGIDADDLAHIVVTHIHVDHAGGAGALLERYPRATLWVHERGAPHLADPTRLIASTARTYGEARMRALFGTVRPCDSARIHPVNDGDRIDLGDRSLHVLHTPGHASHHIALLDDATGAMCTGEAIGSYLPWGPAFRPALPPPEVDVGLALDSLARMREAGPTALLTSHFGPVHDPANAFDRADEEIRTWSDAVRQHLEVRADADVEELTALLREVAGAAFAAETGRDLAPELARYDALGSIRMNAQGLARYWRARPEVASTHHDS